MVETAIVISLTTFLILGLLQLFMAMQARLMAQYAVARATRAGSLNSGDCKAMLHSAVGVLVSTFTRTDSAGRLATAFARRSNNRFLNEDLQLSPPLAGTGDWIVELDRVRPIYPADFPPNPTDQEDLFDLPEESFTGQAGNQAVNWNRMLQVRMTYWYPLRIPFANWVISAMTLAAWNIMAYTKSDPLLPMHRANTAQDDWNAGAALPATVTPTVANEFKTRFLAKHYYLPIQVTYAMRMMTPPRQQTFMGQQICK
jgi:hypothetical protein